MLLEPEDYVASIKCLLDSGHYAIYFFNPPWLVFSKPHNENTKINRESVYRFLDTLEKRWNLDKTKFNLYECAKIK